MTDEGRQLTEDDARQSLHDHILVKTRDARDKYGESIGKDEILAMLSDAEVVRYPTRVRFGADALEDGEFAFAEPIGERPADGFVLHVHPALEARPDDLTLAIAYHVVVINYGEIAGSEEAELYGAHLLGLEVDAYYERLCTIADSLA